MSVSAPFIIVIIWLPMNIATTKNRMAEIMLTPAAGETSFAWRLLGSMLNMDEPLLALELLALRVLALLWHIPIGVLLGLLRLLRNLAKRRLRLALLLRCLRLLRLIFGSRRRRLLRLVVVLLVCFAYYFPWYTSGFRMPI